MVESNWSAAEAALWQRLTAHAFERQDGSVDFLAKLAHQQGWSTATARAAIEEYRRFCFLAVAAGHPVTPSEEVDQVWHLHLTYTRDYWERFCPDVLGCALHHEGGDGLRTTLARHRADYGATLASYQRWFGPPPEAFWPAAAVRFAPATHFRWVDRRRHLILPRPRLTSWRRVAAAALALVAPSAFADSLNPLDWGGPSFLALFVALMLAGLFGGRWLRRQLSGDPDAGGSVSGLDAMQVAYLAGGMPRVRDAGIAQMLSEDALRWDDKQLARGSRSPSSDVLRDLQETVLARAEKRKPNPTIAARPQATLHAALEKRGLVPDAATQFKARLLPALLMAGITAFGVLKVSVGLQRDRPVGFLIFLCIIAGLIAFTFLRARVDRTRAGDKALAQLTLQNTAATRAPREDQLGLAVALVGTTALAGTAFAAYHEARAANLGSSSSCGSSCSSDSSSCSSSDGGSSCSSGCGGCGGGGGD